MNKNVIFFQEYKKVIWNPQKSKFGAFRKPSFQNRSSSLILISSEWNVDTETYKYWNSTSLHILEKPLV